MDGYNYSNGGGDRVRAVDYIPNLAEYNMDNTISYVCVTGKVVNNKSQCVAARFESFLCILKGKPFL